MQKRFLSTNSIKVVGVLGSGLMGNGIAQQAAANGYEVILFDTNEQALKKGMASMDKSLKKLQEKGKVKDAAEILKRVKPTGKMSDLHLFVNISKLPMICFELMIH